MDTALLSASDLARRIRRGEVSAVDALEACLDRYERHNPAVNAVVVERREEARARAAAADEATKRGENWGPLHGVPVTIKDAFDWVGTPSTWGSPALANNFPEVDAVAVQRLLGAGAVIWGKTNVPLMLADWQSFNDVYGMTRNPWDLDRTPGGSSGGSAAALATGMSALEIGSDIGASIRNPAHYCGVFGLKPTWDLVPITGHLPPGDVGSIDIGVAGPLARSADDLDLALGVLAGPAGLDAAGYRADLAEPSQMRLSDFRVGLVLESPCVAQDQQLTDQLQNVADALAAAGVDVVEGARPDMDLRRAHEVYMLLLRAAMGAHATDEEMEAHREIAANSEPDDMSYDTLNSRGVTLSHRDWWQLDQERQKLRLAWANWFEAFDLLLCPTAASAAFPHIVDGTRGSRQIEINGMPELYTDQLFWAGWSCSVYLPAVSAPAGLTRDGLPVGLQIVAPHLQDRRAIRFAQLMERELGGYVPPPGYE